MIRRPRVNQRMLPILRSICTRYTIVTIHRFVIAVQRGLLSILRFMIAVPHGLNSISSLYSMFFLSSICIYVYGQTGTGYQVTGLVPAPGITFCIIADVVPGSTF